MNTCPSSFCGGEAERGGDNGSKARVQRCGLYRYSDPKKQRAQNRSHPWDEISQTPEPVTDFGETEKEVSLRVWARRVAEQPPYNSIKLFRQALIANLKAVRYSPPDSKSDSDGETFEQNLRKAGVLQAILTPVVLEDIRKWVMLNRAFEKERESRSSGESTAGFPVQFHKTFMTELRRHADEVEDIAVRYAAESGIQSYRSVLKKEFRRQFEYVSAVNNPQTWPSLRLNRGGEYAPRIDEIAVKGRLFLFMKKEIQNWHTRQLGISDQFLRQLTELAMGPPSSKNVPSGDAIIYAEKTLKRPRKILE